MKKSTLLTSLLTCVIASGCNSGVSSGDLNHHSLKNSYLDFAVVDQESNWPSVSEAIWANIALNGYNTYSLLGIAFNPQIVLSNADGFSASVNTGVFNNLSQLPFIPAGFYQFNANNVNIPNTNTYTIKLTYQGNTYSANLNNLPVVYTITGDSCTVSGNNLTQCVVDTTNTIGSLPQGANISYSVVGSKGSDAVGCDGNIVSSEVNKDAISFQGCDIQNVSDLEISLQISYSPESISIMQNPGEINMQGEYYFQTKSLPVNY